MRSPWGVQNRVFQSTFCSSTSIHTGPELWTSWRAIEHVQGTTSVDAVFSIRGRQGHCTRTRYSRIGRLRSQYSPPVCEECVVDRFAVQCSSDIVCPLGSFDADTVGPRSTLEEVAGVQLDALLICSRGGRICVQDTPAIYERASRT